MSHFYIQARNALAATLSNRKGVSATEYTLMVVGIAALVLAGATVLGSDISAALAGIGSYLSAAGTGI